LQAGDTACVLTESQSRRVNVELALLALEALQVKAFELCLPARPLSAPVPVRSTGASDAIAQHPAVIAALQNVTLIVDCTVEGLLHAPELPLTLARRLGAWLPSQNAVQGTLALAPGDVNLSFKTYIRDAIELTIEGDYITQIDGTGLDVETFREHLLSWEQHEGNRDTYAVSHVGFGLNPKARWDAMNFYAKRDFNGTELRTFAGNFLYSIGANEVAGRICGEGTPSQPSNKHF
jgi:hypothetical protein